MSAENMGRKSLAKVVLPLDDGPERPIMMVLLLAEDCPALLSDDISFLLLLSCFPRYSSVPLPVHFQVPTRLFVCLS